jgi:hypothetical protein
MQIGIKVGDHIRFVINEPWEVVTANGSGPFPGTVVAVEEGGHSTTVVKLDRPISYEATTARFFLASARHKGKTFDGSPSRSEYCNIVSLTDAEGQACTLRPPEAFQNRLLLNGDLFWEDPGQQHPSS